MMENEFKYWWHGINIENPTKYPVKELKSLDIIHNKILPRVYKTMGYKAFDEIIFFFNDAKDWSLNIGRNTSYGNDSYCMYTHGPRAPWRINWTDLDTDQKRSIMQRLETKTFYIYQNDGFYRSYFIREEEVFKGQKGKLLK